MLIFHRKTSLCPKDGEAVTLDYFKKQVEACAPWTKGLCSLTAEQ
jgi:hypothetical protein